MFYFIIQLSILFNYCNALRGLYVDENSESLFQPENITEINIIFQTGPLVKLDYGVFLGSDNRNGRSYLGIPFAAPPLGNLRFLPPAPPIPFAGIFDARKQGKSCFQDHTASPLHGFRLKMSEDCLNLNIWMPKGHSKKDGLLPVMIWILPGGFSSGYASNPLYDGSLIVKNSKEKIMVVSFNYRMGLFGWANSLQFQKEGLLNVGMKDIIQAFQWVKKYIHNFGGDPNRITGFGESAGAIIIELLLLMKGGSQKIMNRAIIESGTAGFTMDHVKDKQKNFDIIMTDLGCNNAPVLSECLRGISAERLTNKTFDSIIFPYPVIDNDLIREQPFESIAAGRFSKVPLMIGTTTNEGTFFVPKSVNNQKDVKAAIYYLIPFLSELDYQELMSAYPLSKFNGNYYLQAAEIMADRFFQCPSVDIALALSNHNVPVYKYRWNHVLGIPHFLRFYGNRMGVFHFSEVPLIFSQNHLLFKNERKLARLANNAWTSFAKTGTPILSIDGINDDTPWPLYSNKSKSSKRQNVVFDTPINIIISESDSYRDGRCSVWKFLESRRLED